MINISEIHDRLEKISNITAKIAVSGNEISVIKSMIKAMAEVQIHNELNEKYKDLGIQVQEDPMADFLNMKSLFDDPLDVLQPLEPPKQDMPTLKKRIKYCKNPMEKWELEQELNALYKEKKRNKRIGRNNNGK